MAATVAARKPPYDAIDGLRGVIRAGYRTKRERWGKIVREQNIKIEG